MRESLHKSNCMQQALMIYCHVVNSDWLPALSMRNYLWPRYLGDVM